MSVKVFVGGLPMAASRRDVEDEFNRFGSIDNIDVKRGFAFVEFRDARDAGEAVRAMHGKMIAGASRPITVEVSKPRAPRGDDAPRRDAPRDGGRDAPPRDYGRDAPRDYGRDAPRDYGRDDRYGGGGRDDRYGRDAPRDYGRDAPRDYGRDDRYGGGGRDDRYGGRDSGRDDRYGGGRDSGRDAGRGARSQYRLLVTGLPASTGWQDLKDFARKACRVGRVNFTDAKPDPASSSGDKVGIIEFSDRDDMEEGLRVLPEETIQGVKVRVEEERSDNSFRSIAGQGTANTGGRGGGGDRDRRGGGDRGDAPQAAAAVGRGRSRSRSPLRGRERSRSYDRSHVEVASAIDGDAGALAPTGNHDAAVETRRDDRE